jgi:hypothetical protein
MLFFFSLSIMDIAAYTMTLQTNCRDQTFVSIVTFRELQSASPYNGNEVLFLS